MRLNSCWTATETERDCQDSGSNSGQNLKDPVFRVFASPHETGKPYVSALKGCGSSKFTGITDASDVGGHKRMETDVDEPVLGSDEPIRKFQQAISGKEAVEARLKQLSAQVMPAIWDEFIRFVSDSAPDHCWEACCVRHSAAPMKHPWHRGAAGAA